jgi:Cys-tRNA(Pro) deacylase
MNTPATAFLAKHGVGYTEHEFEYVEHGGTSHSSTSLGVPEHQVVKTLIMENERGDPLVVLMHGDRKVSTKELARQAGVKRIAPCKPEAATRHSGYINGGRRGYLLGMDPSELTRVLSPKLVDVAIEE